MITIGTDPEVAVVSGGQIVSVTGMIGAGKANPLPVTGGFIQEDNVSAEFNTEAHTSFESFNNNIGQVINELLSYVPGIEFKTSHHFEKAYLQSLGSSVLHFGCDPDFNAWTGEENEKPSPYTTLRSFAGHVHIGYDNPDKDTSNKLVQLCDVFLGVPSLLMDPDTERRELYGKAGACRYKDYGVEYRTLSNFWVASEDTRK